MFTLRSRSLGWVVTSHKACRLDLIGFNLTECPVLYARFLPKKMASMEVDEDVAAEATSSSQSVAVESSSQAAGNTSNFTAPTSPAPPAQPATGGGSGSALSDVSPGNSVMASAGTVGSVSVSLHPLVILNISEHWTRQRAQEVTSEVQVLGALIGKQTGRHVEIMNSFELSYDMLDGNIIINREYYTLKEEQYKQVFSDLDLLGWYTTGDTPGPPDLLVHKQICDLLDSPIFLKLNPMARHTDLPVSIYESVLDLVNGVPTLLLVELQYTLATEEAERIGVDHVARMSSHDVQESSIVAENLQAQYSAIKMLASRVRLIAEYVKASQRGEVEFNHEILRQVNALAHRLPVLNSEKFRGEFYNQCNDVALMSYLGTITKCCNTMNRFINRFNLLHERLAMGQSISYPLPVYEEWLGS
ncbi:COP9 constitutive photomorphogenic-like protein subunit 6 [Penaeus vannamei]|uniref:COP9 signalosome complex subunit 6 n=1 Tax=Penaeus vannamei TaxID=6689 RepID=A0A423TSE3_PENVA|nr:COP9 constitutive photomorphogenic-like protein subunit 6 [Penaeus vannamei]